MTTLNSTWTILKSFIDHRGVPVQWVEADNNYYLFAYDGQFAIACVIPKSDPASAAQTEFEEGYKANGNVSPNTVVTTQYEMNNKDLKLARGKSDVDGTGKATVSLKVPGTFGSGDGRYVAGGYGISDDYDKDDFVTVRIEDTDRLIALAIAQTLDPTATEPLADADVQALGDFPSYPIVKSYTDDEVPVENQGWYFWSNARGNSLDPCGECEIEPIGGYGFLPSGMYIKLEYNRGSGKITGSLRVNFYWGKKE